MFGTEVIIIDPEGEYEALSTTLGGEHVSFTPSDPVKINPFDLSGLYEEGENELGLKILSLHGLLRIVMGKSLNPQKMRYLTVRSLRLTDKKESPQILRLKKIHHRSWKTYTKSFWEWKTQPPAGWLLELRNL